MTRRTTIRHGGRTVTIEYRPDRFADPEFRALLAHVVATNDLEASARALARVLVAWSLGTPARPVPITAEAILGLPFALPVALVRGIAEDGRQRERAARKQGGPSTVDIRAASAPPPWEECP